MPASVWKGHITFGLVSFPVQLFAAARPEAVHFHMLHKKDLSRVKEIWYCAAENKPIERSEIVKGYEAKKGEYVIVDDAELKAVAPVTATTMEVVQFVREADVDPIYFERSYYVAPGENVAKPYALFWKALQDTKYSAIAKVSMHGREHVVLLRANSGGLVLHTLFYSGELHKANRPATPAKTATARKELDLATELIHKLAASFDPEQFHDAYRDNVEKLIEQKQKGQPVTTEPKPRRAPVIDLMDALKQSLAKSAKANKTTSDKAKPAKTAVKTRSARKRKAA